MSGVPFKLSAPRGEVLQNNLVSNATIPNKEGKFPSVIYLFSEKQKQGKPITFFAKIPSLSFGVVAPPRASFPPRMKKLPSVKV